jgi:hypothetical protein
VYVKYFLARSAPSDQRWDASVGASGGHPGSYAMEGRSFDVDQRSWVQAYPSRGVERDTSGEEDSRGERSDTVWQRRS